MNVRFPIFAGPLGPTLQTAFQTVSAAFGRVMSQDEGASRFILTDANGQNWQVSITTGGAVTTTTISGKTRQI